MLTWTGRGWGSFFKNPELPVCSLSNEDTQVSTLASSPVFGLRVLHFVKLQSLWQILK